MQVRLHLLTVSLALISLFFICLHFPVSSYAQQTQPWQQINTKCVDPNNNDVATIQGFECLFFNILQVVVSLAGLVFLFVFLKGGFAFLFSGNDAKKVASASSSLTMAIIGLVGIILAWLILHFIEAFFGIPVTIFRIPGP